MSEFSEAFEYLGWYPIGDAKLFLDALEEADIPCEAAFEDGISQTSGIGLMVGNFGADAGVHIAIEPHRFDEIEPIHQRIFGSSLPSFHGETEEWESELAPFLRERDELREKLAGLEGEMEKLLEEGKAVDLELRSGGQTVERTDALRRSLSALAKSSQDMRVRHGGLVEALRVVEGRLAGSE